MAMQDAQDLDVRGLDPVVNGVGKAMQQGATHLRIDEGTALWVTLDAIYAEQKLINEFAPQCLAPILIPGRGSLEVLPRERTKERSEVHRLRRIVSATSRA